ncbi:MAG: acyl-CoA dehydrogenase family protein [Planctomycetes bacterium]|nr:acyl-CoA dehydrogenase family protein [Planctomycetota bacterium]
MPNLPGPFRESYWEADPVLRDSLRRRLPERTLAAIRPEFEALGRSAAREVAPLAAVADRCPPRLVTHDPCGDRIDAVEYHPAYREMERIAYGSGIVAVKYEPAADPSFRAHRHSLGFALGYLFGQAECGLFCPVCMTDGVARVLERSASQDLARLHLPRLASRTLDRLYRGAMFVTEKAGGSDVGATETRAVPASDGWRLHGEKWFCSNVDAEAILTLARPEGAPAGTRGLGLFLVLRDLSDGRRNALRIHRLKDKLGVRSMPTGEVALEGSLALPVGGLEDGFRQMAEMLNLSRLYNAVAAAAALRRATNEAAHFSRERRAFGRAVADHPLQAETLAELELHARAATLFVFDLVAELDRADAGDEAAARKVRLTTPIAKYWTAKLGVKGVSEAMECLGGCGYIEDWPLARLLRDTQVLPIWEGTTNILVLDTLRAATRSQATEELLADASARVARAPVPAAARRAGEGAIDVARRLSSAVVGRVEPAAVPPREARQFADALARAHAASLLLEQGEERLERFLEPVAIRF